MRCFLITLFILASLLLPALAIGQEERIHEYVVVTANRFEEFLRDVPFSITVIDEKEIVSAGFKSLDELLRAVSGIEVAQSGSKGHLTSAFIRGANSNHNLILVDGIPIKTMDSYSSDISKIPVQLIERVEIIRGPQSTIWGTDAIGGVINIITKKGKGLKGELGYGSDSSFSTSLYGGAQISQFFFNSSFNLFTTKGNFENDDFKLREFNLRAGRAFEKGEVSLFFRSNNTETGIPFNLGWASLNRREKSSENLFHIPLRLNFKSTEIRLDLSFIERKYRFSDPEDPWGYSKTFTNSRVARAYFYGKTEISSNNNLFWGVDGSVTKIFDEDSWGVNLAWERINERAIFLNDIWKPFEKLVIQGGVRAQWNSQFGSHISPRVGISYIFPENLKLRLAFGEGFRAPIPLEFAGPLGNRELKPEKGRSGEIGIDQTLFDGKFLWNITYFQNRYEDLITFDFQKFKMGNLNSARSEGLEIAISLFPFQNFSFESFYTYLKTRDINGEPLLRRPKNSFISRINWSPFSMLNIYIFHEIRGKRKDIDERTFMRTENPSFNRTNLNLRVGLNSHLFLSFAVQNLFNMKIEEIYGYPSPDRSIFLSLEMR
ncbi:MAG: TonB-dependent receptor plug domain-containing protein [Candidatus Aminicenantia bacterium]